MLPSLRVFAILTSESMACTLECGSLLPPWFGEACFAKSGPWSGIRRAVEKSRSVGPSDLVSGVLKTPP